MSEDKGGFTVADKRHFSPDGTPRPSAPGPSGAPAEGGNPPVATLSALFLSLAAQAGLLLREASPEQDEDAALPAPDPDGARQVIAILELLEDKTEGRRTAEESRLLGDVLYQLRMAYLARTRREG